MTIRSLVIAPLLTATVLMVAALGAGPLDPPGEPSATGVSLADIAEAAALNATFTRFNPDGVPVRAVMSVSTSDGSPEIVGNDALGPFNSVIEIHGLRVNTPGSRFNGRYRVTEARHIFATKRADATTPLLIHAACTGRALDAVTVEVFTADPLMRLQQIQLMGAAIVDLSMGTTLNADGNEVAVEELVITYEGLRMTDVPTGLVTELHPDGSCTVTPGAM